jgi:hypothetical protein
MKTTKLLGLIITALVALSQPTWARGGGGGGGGGGVGTAVVAAVTLLEAVLVAATLLEVTSAALAVPVLAVEDFVQPRICMGALILPVEVLADQPVHSDTTPEAAARLLLGHTSLADGETNR